MDKEIIVKSGLYALALFLSPFADKLVPILMSDTWPSVPMTFGCIILGAIAASIGLRAYFDGSYERSKPDMAITVSKTPGVPPAPKT